MEFDTIDEYEIGERVEINVGNDSNPQWIKAEVTYKHPVVKSHIHVKLVCHLSTVRKLKQ